MAMRVSVYEKLTDDARKIRKDVFIKLILSGLQYQIFSDCQTQCSGSQSFFE